MLSASVVLRLADQGEDLGRLVTVADDAREALIDKLLDQHADATVDKVAHAIALFRHRGATFEDKRSAAIALAGILEDRRSLLKAELITKDENALFQIANSFAIRHQNPAQQSDYGEAFIDWIFWLYAATVELCDRLLARCSGIVRAAASRLYAEHAFASVSSVADLSPEEAEILRRSIACASRGRRPAG